MLFLIEKSGNKYKLIKYLWTKKPIVTWFEWLKTKKARFFRSRLFLFTKEKNYLV